MNQDSIVFQCQSSLYESKNKRRYSPEVIYKAISEYENNKSAIEFLVCARMNHKNILLLNHLLEIQKRKPNKEVHENEYRKFIEESKYGRITIGNGPLSIPRIQYSKSNGNNIKYDSRRFFNGMGK